MKIGDLVREREYPEVGLIVDETKHHAMFRTMTPCYAVLTPTGSVEWFEKEYIETECEVVSEGG
tara:strand:- start:24 stop:215 length:192 start_codon:yes stop_codon:yes gene_type:complete